MRLLILRTIAVVVASGLLAAPGAGSPTSYYYWTVPLDLTAGPVTFRPIAAEGLVEPRIAGFGQTSRPGEPALPIRILLVAIPEGSTPELVIHDTRSEVRTGVDLAPVPRLRPERDRSGAREMLHRSLAPDGFLGSVPARATGRRREFIADREIFARDEEFPAVPLRLGSVGYMREQRFVEVLYTPLLYNPVRREARLVREMRAEVRFAVPDDALTGAPLRPDRQFESTYRLGLVNYEQGRLFRRSGRSMAPDGGLGPSTRPDATGATALAFTGAPRYKIFVSQPGVYRLDHSYLQTNAPDLLAQFPDPTTWLLQAGGVGVPISIRSSLGGPGEGDGSFDTDDFLEFYGQPKREPPTVLNHNFPGLFPDIYQSNDFTDTQVYWLTGATPAGSHLRIPEVSGAPALPGFPQATDFGAAAVWEENNFFNPLGAADPFFSIPSLLAGGSSDQRDLALDVPGIAPGAGDASATARLRGGSGLTEDPDHRTRVWFNSDTGGAADFTWDDEVIHEETFPVAQSVLTDPSTIHVELPGISGVSVDRQYLDNITLRYRRTFAAPGEGLTFPYPNQDSRFKVTGLGSVAPVIYEVGRILAGSDEADPVRFTGALAGGAPTSNYTFEVAQDTAPSAPAVRTFIVAGPAALRLPDAIVEASDPVLTTSGNAADILVIAAREVVETSPGVLTPSLESLLAHRLSVQGLTSRVVFIDEIYDEFSFGLRDANAIRSFLAYAYANWRGPAGTDPPPSFALLVGDGTPDYQNRLNLPEWVDQVPTPIMFQTNSIFGYYSSDNYLASFLGGDQIPDIHLGRISTRTVAAAADVFDKIRQYETSAPAGAWRGRAVLVAGDGKIPFEAEGFEAINDEVAAIYFSAAPFSTTSPPLYYEQPPWNSSDPVGFNSALLAEIEDLDKGATVLNFVGHGNFTDWGLDGFFSTTDAVALTNSLRLPFMVNVNCLAGGFHFLGEDFPLGSGALGETLLGNPGGGAIAVLAPSGLSSTFVGDVIVDELFFSLFGPTQERVLGAATSGLRAALWGRGSITDLQSYTFLGDPATVLATPAPQPPSALMAVEGNGRVDLSWTAPPVPAAELRIYRAAGDSAAPYASVACDPITTTSCADRTVINATRYYYYALSVDADGFEGRPSNLNSDCDAGPDCVTALPINPGPPSVPTGFEVLDGGVGATLVATWDPATERDIDTYNLRYGTQPGLYDVEVNVAADETSLVLGGLTDGVRYYLVLSATNTSGRESATTTEISAVPHLVQGIAPPRVIADLRLALAGPDIVLTWSRPLVDIYDRPTVVTGYRVYRGTTPGFALPDGLLIAAIGDGDTTTCTDAGAAIAPGSFYYLVTALGAGGFASGGGHDLPNGIVDLTVTTPAPDTLRLAWSAVATDVQGTPTVIVRYLVYMSDTPFGRANLDTLAPPLDLGAGSSVDLPLSTSLTYLSVIAVDSRGNLSPF